MENTITISLSGTDIQHLQNKYKALNAEQSDIVRLESANIESAVGVVETITIITAVLTFASGVSAQILASWIYDRFLKDKSEKDTEENISIEGVMIDKKSDSLHLEIEKIIIKKINPK